MPSTVLTVFDYINKLQEPRQSAINSLREAILSHLPPGFEETINYGMIGYVVPHSLYPAGYHCDPSLPLPFINLASQKSYLALYHMGIYTDPELMAWFQEAYPKHTSQKLDMGKSCIRFRKTEDLPYTLIGELAAKVTVAEWIAKYEATLKK
ncbi:uncharacterized protein DUF1801 [Dyadobacter jejuensis]|uniref:Uncharacterized protein DUF1801 n=1 Tax=Dyadobacter jejuensis TaxID=1082580 RepID=A0A316ACV4_9BACT|nr:DUF1801 domain-containing protein [Dyadobacter jejuensis]PWJ55616.1 uncharacterized protein DUF1801 [Dyadobacter jejuensis]